MCMHAFPWANTKEWNGCLRAHVSTNKRLEDIFKSNVYVIVHVNSLGMLGLGHLSFPKVPDSKTYVIPSRLDYRGARCRSGVVYYLVGECHRGAVREGSRLITPLQEKG